LIWNTALISAGYALKSQWDDVEPVLDVVQYVVVAAIVGVVAWFIWSRRRRPAPTP
jgi:membrane protein DedA with SNARE-associated domain